MDVYYIYNDYPIIVFMTAFIGALVTLMCLIFIDLVNMSDSDKYIMTTLISIAFILPIFILIYLICKKGEKL